ncbi:AAA domain protein [uncultured archaeon]|nr:AAA domain protein [uncultured archaeon]
MEERHRTLLIKQNPWWQERSIKLPEFERDLHGKILKYVKYRQIIAIVGLRRVGKTVLIKQILQKLEAPKNNLCYISLDDMDFQKYNIAEDLINYFLEFSEKNKTRYLFLDEVQKLPNWSDLLKTLYDTEENIKIFISGSASLELSKFKETLAGRIFTFHMPVLTFKEFARYYGMESGILENGLFRDYDFKYAGKKERYRELFESYLIKGAFPELFDINDEEFIKKYIRESVIEKAIADIARLSGEDEKIIFELLRLLANSNARLFEIVNLSTILKVNRNRVSHYMSLLEKSFLINVSYNFTASIAKQVRAGKKQYSAHSCIVIAMLDYSFDVLNTEIAGHLAEAAVAGNLDSTAFWRTPQKEEVDIVVKKKEGPLPVEVKYQSHITNSDLKSVVKFCRNFNARRGIVLTKELLERREMDDAEILLVPVWLYLLVYDQL